MTAPLSNQSQATVLFDGVCNLCNASVRFIIHRDSRQRFQFATLQSEIGQQLLADHHVSKTMPDSVILIQEQRLYFESTAALKIAKQLDGPWPIFSIFLYLPKALRDAIYRVVGTYRYAWFGKREHCMIPTTEIRQRFLTEHPDNHRQ